MENQLEKQFDINEIKLMVGLGNLGREYDQTRHNIGFEFIDTLAGSNKFNNEVKFKSLTFTKDVGGKKLILIKPSTFMNSSGEAVVLVSKYYNIEPHEILIVHDDLDLMLGSYKIQFAKGPKLHNGLLSIQNRLGTNKFWRLRIGVENRDSNEKQFLAGHSYVLSKFKTSEMDKLLEIFNEIENKSFQI